MAGSNKNQQVSLLDYSENIWCSDWQKEAEFFTALLPGESKQACELIPNGILNYLQAK